MARYLVDNFGDNSDRLQACLMLIQALESFLNVLQPEVGIHDDSHSVYQFVDSYFYQLLWVWPILDCNIKK